MSQATLDLSPSRRPRIDHLKPQAQQVGRHLVEHGSITDLEALDLYRIRRLSGRIYELRGADWPIETRNEPHAGGYHARYVLR